MIPIPAALLFTAFVFLSGLHFFWALGGKWGQGNAIPETDGVPVFSPGKLATAVVGFALLGAALVPIWRVGVFEIGPSWLSNIAVWAIAAVFALRAVGDFRYCGFFKRQRGTAFARNDSLVYSPLCVLLSALAVWLSLTN